MKKALIVRGSLCLGDLIFISWVPRQLKEKKGYDYVAVTTWRKNMAIWENNPYVDKLIMLDEIGNKDFDEMKKKWEVEHDFFDFRYTVEGRFLKFSHENTYSVETLRENAKGKNYYKDALAAFDLSNDKGELYLSESEKILIDKFKEQKTKRILWQATGGGRNKIIMWAPAYINELTKKIPDVEHWLMGDSASPITVLQGKNIQDMRGKLSTREALAHVPIFDLVIGPESFFINTAAAFGIPSLTFYSHSTPENLIGHLENSHAVIPNCDCHPCYEIIKQWRKFDNLEHRARAREKEDHCLLRDAKDHFRALGFKCSFHIDHKSTIEKIIKLME